MGNFIPALGANISSVKAAIIGNGVVKNVISIDPNNSEFIKSSGVVLVPTQLAVDHGWLYDGTTFSQPTTTKPLSDQAYSALTKSDSVILRCACAGVPVPKDWHDYRVALRNIANGTDTTSTVLPTQPQYPQGT